MIFHIFYTTWRATRIGRASSIACTTLGPFGPGARLARRETLLVHCKMWWLLPSSGLIIHICIYIYIYISIYIYINTYVIDICIYIYICRLWLYPFRRSLEDTTFNYIDQSIIFGVLFQWPGNRNRWRLEVSTMWCPSSLAKLAYNSNNYDLW